MFCENRNIDVLKQAFEEELGYAVPQIYRRQVAHLAKLYRDGTAEGPETRVEGRRNIETTRARLFENVDGVKFLIHHGGCGGTREDSETLCGLIAGYIHHPNVAGATVLSLGCQSAQVEILRREIYERNRNSTSPC